MIIQVTKKLYLCVPKVIINSKPQSKLNLFPNKWHLRILNSFSAAKTFIGFFNAISLGSVCMEFQSRENM